MQYWPRAAIGKTFTVTGWTPGQGKIGKKSGAHDGKAMWSPDALGADGTSSVRTVWRWDEHAPSEAHQRHPPALPPCARRPTRAPRCPVSSASPGCGSSPSSACPRTALPRFPGGPWRRRTPFPWSGCSGGWHWPPVPVALRSPTRIGGRARCRSGGRPPTTPSLDQPAEQVDVAPALPGAEVLWLVQHPVLISASPENAETTNGETPNRNAGTGAPTTMQPKSQDRWTPEVSAPAAPETAQFEHRSMRCTQRSIITVADGSRRGRQRTHRLWARLGRRGSKSA